MLQTDPDIILQYFSSKDIKAILRLSNPASNMIICFKIKTTKPDLFRVNPSKGFLQANKQKSVEISINGQHGKQDIKNIALSLKFLIEYILIPEKMRQEQIQAEWKILQKTEGGIKRHKLRIKLEDSQIKDPAKNFQNQIRTEQSGTIFRSTYEKTGDILVDQKQDQKSANVQKGILTNSDHSFKKPQQRFASHTSQSLGDTSVPVSAPKSESLTNNNPKFIKTAFLFALIVILILSVQSLFGEKQELPTQIMKEADIPKNNDENQNTA